MISIIVDIDDTLIDTKVRTKQIMDTILECKIPLEELDVLTQQQIFEKYASDEQKAQAKELRQKFLNALLCKSELGFQTLKYNKPIPHAAKVLQMWEKTHKIIYLTGRLNIIFDETFDELSKFGYPVDNTDLHMFNPDDWENGVLHEARERILGTITQSLKVIRVIDDYPGYFQAYKLFSIPERIGYRHSQIYSSKEYLAKGATQTINSWSELLINSKDLS